MPLEIIRRKDGVMSQKQEIRHQHTQFSLNSYGHLCIREFSDPQKIHKCVGDIKNENCPLTTNGSCLPCVKYQLTLDYPEEHLLVLDKPTTDSLIKFIFENRSTYEFKKLLAALIFNDRDELPF